MNKSIDIQHDLPSFGIHSSETRHKKKESVDHKLSSLIDLLFLEVDNAHWKTSHSAISCQAKF